MMTGFFDKLSQFRTAQPIGWEYRYKHLTLLGVAPVPTNAGFIVPSLTLAGFDSSIYKFTSASIITRIDLTFIVYDGTVNQLFGAAVIKNPTPVVDVNGADNAFLVSYARNNLTTLPPIVS